MSRADAIGAWCAVIAAFAVAGYLAFKMGDVIYNPPKSERQSCAERGGIWVDLRSGARCFSKEAFK